jgi:hypothetical protein
VGSDIGSVVTTRRTARISPRIERSEQASAATDYAVRVRAMIDQLC